MLATAVFLAGCSAMQLTYNQADTLISWRADSYFDFDPTQKHEFHQRLDRLLAWHRREQLPDGRGGSQHQPAEMTGHSERFNIGSHAPALPGIG